MDRNEMLCPCFKDICKCGFIANGPQKEGFPVKCRLWTDIAWTNPQTGQTENRGDCSLMWLPTLLIESVKGQAHTTSAIESLRNLVASPVENNPPQG